MAATSEGFGETQNTTFGGAFMANHSDEPALPSTPFPQTEDPAPAPAPPSGGGQAAENPTDVTPGRPEQSERSLPCLNSNNCNDRTEGEGQNPFNLIRPYHQKQQFVIKHNAEKFIEQTGLEKVAFFTLTFPDQLTDHKEAARRFKSFRTGFFQIFGHWHLVKERTVEGYIHFHLLVDCNMDVRTGFDFDLYERSCELKQARKPYRHVERRAFKTANANLRNLWATLRQFCPNYGFGRHELLPIRTTAEAAAKYIGKYISKHVGARSEDDKGVRIYSRSQGQTGANCKIAWHSPGAMEWRRKVKAFAYSQGCTDMESLKEKLGSKWCYYYVDTIKDADRLLQVVTDRVPF